MKVAIIGASGYVGSHVLGELLTHTDVEVTAVVRGVARLPTHPRLTAAACDLREIDLLTEILRGHDAVIHAFHPSREASDVYEQNVAGHRAVIAAVNQAGVSRFLAVGGAASLMTPEGVEYLDSSFWNPEFDPYRDAIRGTRALLYLLKEEEGLDWVFVAPSAMLRPGERTGVFRYGKDDMLFDEDGSSRISLEDYAMAFVGELLHPRHHRERFTVGY